jgi:hypothetical protein
MRRFVGFLSPTNWIYVLVHFCLLLIGFILLGYQSPTAKAIGASLVAAGVAGWVVLVYVLQAQGLSERIKIVLDFGFLSAFAARSVRIKREYDSRLSVVSQKIDVMGFGLKTLREDYAREFSTWRGRAAVRILLIDPYYPVGDSTYADQRDLEEQDKIGSIREDVEAFLKEVAHHLATDRPHTFQVRLYRCLPSVNLFRVDSELFWGPYLIHQQSRNSPTFIVKEGPLFTILMDHFDAIWSSDHHSCSIEEYRAAHPEAADGSR